MLDRAALYRRVRRGMLFQD